VHGKGHLRETTRLSMSRLYDELLATLTDPAVRDLAWLLTSPGLLRAQQSSIRQAQWDTQQMVEIRQWLCELDREPAALHAELLRLPQKRLGHYAEQLLAYFLVHGKVGRLIAANLAVRHGNRTLGECDFLLSAPDGALVHWELAVKCYLYAGARLADESVDEPGNAAPPAPYAELAQYVGPDLTDRFDRKLSHMVDHQLPLSARPEFAAQIDAGPWRPELFLKGWLFYPLAQPASEPHRWVEPRHLRGWWVTPQAWREQRSVLAAQGWLVLSRRSWLAPRQANTDAPILDDAALDAFLAAQFAPMPVQIDDVDDDENDATVLRNLTSPVLIAAMVRNGDGWQERSRGFVVEPQWVARAVSFAASEPGSQPRG
jgi:hypothetical protein